MFDCAPKLSDEQIVEIFKESPVVGTDLTTIRTTDLFALCANAKDRNAIYSAAKALTDKAPKTGTFYAYTELEALRALLEEK